MKESTTTRHGQVLVAVDGSPASIEAVRYGHSMAVLLGARLTVVTAWEPLRHGVLPPISTHPFQAAEQLVALSVLAAFRGEVVPEYETVAVEGDPVDGLVRLSRDADLLVIGSRGHSGFAGALLGSISGACAAHAHCPVTVVHAPPATSAHQGSDTVTAGERIVVTL
jgi:nucleotide-binding universal stress UspA family protein